MYLKGSKLSLKPKRKRPNPWVILFLLAIIGGLIYLNVVVVPTIPPLFVPTPTPTRDPVSYEIEAEGLASEGKYTAAIEGYKLAINANPQNVQNYINLAKLQIYTGAFEEAKVNAENAILLNKNNAQSYGLLAWALGFQGNYLEAEVYVKQGIQIDQNSAFVHAVYAYILALRVTDGTIEIGTVDLAIEESRTALELDPSLLETRWARGFVLEVTSNYEDAVEQLEIANQINNNIADLHQALGRNYSALEEYDQAVFEFTKAYSLNPTDPDPNFYISRIYARLGEFAKAIQYAEQAVKDDPGSANLQANLGTMYYRNGQFNQALTYLELAVRGGVTETGVVVEGILLAYSDPIIEIYSRYGLALANVNRCNEAVQVAQALIQGVPDDEIAMFNADAIIGICQDNLTNPPTQTPAPTSAQSQSETPTP
ncbi:MAG: tetratricopeptide repeat protein [Anaerolineaceae bacterium]|nr:tetratricopeptide repeat protein [Anaerolineaceae bacterium]